MKKLYSILTLILISFISYAQPYETNPDFNRTRNWHFGYEIGLHFAPDTILFTGSVVPPTEATSVHTDQEGNLLLYSNGETIWNANHEIIHNGNLSLGSYSSRQGSVFVLHEDNPNNIYLFNTNFSLSNKELSFNLIVKEADTFRVVFKDSVLQIGISEPIAVVKADNGRDIWIITHIFNGNNFVSYRLTKEGLIPCPINSVSHSFVGGNFSGAQFAMKFTSDGRYLIKSNTNAPLPIIIKSVELYEFNLSTGKFEFLYSIDSMQLPVHGISFSKSYNNIYVIERDMHINVFNFYPDDSLRTVQSKKQLQVEGYQYHEMFKYEIQNLTYTNQLALAILDSTYLAVLNDHELADSTTITSKGIPLGGKPASLGLPNFNQSYFYNPSINFTVKLDCVYNTIQFNGQDTFSGLNHDWLISKQGMTHITSNIKTPLIEFDDTGIYSVRYIVSNGSRSDTVSKEVTIFPEIQKDFLGNDTGWCNVVGAPITLQAPSAMHCYEWNTGEVSSSITADTAGIYIAKITTPNFCVLHDTIVISVDTFQTISNNFLGEDKFWCENIDTVVILSAPQEFDNYKWSNGITNQHLITNEEGIYYVEAFKRNQCSNGGNQYAYDTIEIILLSAPDKLTLNRIDDSLFVTTSESYNYNWYRNNSLLGDTTDYLILPDTGYYFLKVSKTNGCSNNSDTLYAVTLGIKNPLFYQIKLYPNPTNGLIAIELSSSDKYEFKVKTLTGELLQKGILSKNLNNIDISQYSDGVYFFNIYNNEQSITYKIIKQSE